ncbi:MAG: hypothetical protein GTN53_27725 [Candidatus Aminicenantes bacterium]|nr:hypothetical protein [Candidatus Aminicenantes bacterium]NIQ70274.1 hypothetical protein [Candidatus Aminicenantes bacterium]NIT26305.1 hypothetical protein [Candidatus Aminicenantes bacterium]
MFDLWRTICPNGPGWLADFGAAGVSDLTNSLNNSARRMIHAPRTLYPIIPNMSMDIRELQAQKILYGFFQKKFRFYSENQPKTAFHINSIFFGMKNQVLACGPDERDSSGPHQHHILFLAAKTREETRRREEKKKITNSKSQITNNIQYTNHKSQTILNTHMSNGSIPLPVFEVTFNREPIETNFFIERVLKSSFDLFGILVIGIWNLFVICNLEFVNYMAVLLWLSFFHKTSYVASLFRISINYRWVSPGGSKKRYRWIMNGKGQMVKTLRKNNIQLNVRKVLASVNPWECKTNYLANKRFSLAVSGNRLNQNTHETKYTSLMHGHGASFIFVNLIVPVCMTLLPPCKHNSQPYLPFLLPLPILSIHLSLESSPLPLTCNQGAKSIDRRQLALRPALFLCALFLWAAVADRLCVLCVLCGKKVLLDKKVK